MDPTQTSQYRCANKVVRASLLALQDLLGKNGLNAMLKQAGLTDYIEQYPADNLAKGIPYAEFNTLNAALETTLGTRGGRGLAFQAGRVVYEQAFNNLGIMAGIHSPEFKGLPLQAKINLGLSALGKILQQTCDMQCTVRESGPGEFNFEVHPCPFCWDRSRSDQPVCAMLAGLITESLKWISEGGKYQVTETECTAMGYPVCRFAISQINV